LLINSKLKKKEKSIIGVFRMERKTISYQHKETLVVYKQLSKGVSRDSLARRDQQLETVAANK
jgi:hypothetical protein